MTWRGLARFMRRSARGEEIPSDDRSPREKYEDFQRDIDRMFERVEAELDEAEEDASEEARALRLWKRTMERRVNLLAIALVLSNVAWAMVALIRGRWAEPFAWAFGIPASIFALGSAWKHSGLTIMSPAEMAAEEEQWARHRR